MMYLVEGRNPKETRGQYVLTKEAAYAILEEMKQDFIKVNIYEKNNGEYKRIEKWEREMTNYDWLNSLPIEQQAEALSNIAFKVATVATFYNGMEKPDSINTATNSLYKKNFWFVWLKQPYKEDIYNEIDDR
ncbi:MAG: hypothetical protein IJ880_14960 [Bacilli bacterium]|nr:hypothetical protein [Bacilli bacterium]